MMRHEQFNVRLKPTSCVIKELEVTVVGALNLQDRKMKDKKKFQGVENAELENDGQKCRAGKCRTGK